MSNIGNHIKSIEGPTGSNNTERIQQFAKYLHNFLPCLEKEYDELEKRQSDKPNNVFPIKMKALAYIYEAAGPLYEWYCLKAK